MLQILGLLAKRLPLSAELQDDDPRLTKWLQVYQESPYRPKLVWSFSVLQNKQFKRVRTVPDLQPPLDGEVLGKKKKLRSTNTS